LVWLGQWVGGLVGLWVGIAWSVGQRLFGAVLRSSDELAGLSQ